MESTLRSENERLREENLKLRDELERRKQKTSDHTGLKPENERLWEENLRLREELERRKQSGRTGLKSVGVIQNYKIIINRILLKTKYIKTC